MRSPYGLSRKDKTLINAKKSCQSSVDLRGEYLSSLPRVLYQKPLITSLKYLEISYNDFCEIPKEVCLLVNLQQLYIQHNKVKYIPEELCHLIKLQRLGLAHNEIQSIPKVFNQLTELEWLNLSGNKIEVVPLFILRCPKLKCLRMLCNPIKNVPREIYIQGLKALQEYFNIKVDDISNCSDNIEKSVNDEKHLKVARKLFDNETLFNDNLSIVQKFKGNAKTPQEHSFTENTFIYSEVVSKVQHSQKCELQLLKDMKEKLQLRQELRRMNLEYLRNQPIKRKSFTRSRKISDLSLDSGIRDYNSRRHATSEYGSFSTFPYQDDHHGNSDVDSDDGCTSVISSCNQVSIVTDDCSEADLSEVELPPTSKRHINHGDICVIIPEYNLSGHFQSQFYLEIIQDLSYEPLLRPREVLASEIIQMEPHGALFYKSDPAIISMPYDVKVMSKDQIVCWCSDTGIGQKTNWKPMEKSSYTVFDDHVVIRALHFSLFAVVAHKQYPSAQRLIKKGIGGCLYVDEVPGVEVNFPETSLFHDIEASIKVLYADDPYDVDHDDPTAFALAAPVVELGPHGCQFDVTSGDLVTVRLPLINGKDILEMYGDCNLTFWCSSTKEDEPLNWQQFTPRTVSIDVDDESLCSVYFSVEHFTFFRVLWDVLDAVLYEAKLSASHFLPVFQFYVSCQALMSESEDGVRFGLCISCSRFGKPLEGVGNFPIPIGNHPPKMISTGPLMIRVISGLFEADTAAGQESLLHTENFTGRQIVVQFICKFTGEVPAFGSFGRVEIQQAGSSGSSPTNMFFFNLDKPRDAMHFQSSHAWDVHLSRELAALVTISTERDMGDEVWEDIAHALRYTEAEITKIASSADPMTELLANYKRRGGQPHEFITAMYSIGQYQTSPHNMKTGGRNINTTGEPSSSSSTSQMCPCVNKRKRKLPDDTTLEDKFNEVTGKILGKWKELGRLLKVSENKLTEIEQDHKQYGVREQAFQMLLAWRDDKPDQCSLNTLSSALCKMGLGYVARQSCMIEMG